MKTSLTVLTIMGVAVGGLVLAGGSAAGNLAAADTKQAASAPAGGQVKGELKKNPRILFIGNSYTFVNDLPQLVTALLAAGGRKTTVGEFLAGSTSFRDHWNQNAGTGNEPKAANRKGQLDKLLADKAFWDFAVLQGQSQETLFAEQMETAKYAGMLVEKIRQANPQTKPIFYMTWARQNQPENQATITKVYMNLARENKALVAPVGEAWKAAFAARPGLVLHQTDQSHPNAAGTYIAGCVFCAVVTGKSPVGLPNRILPMKDVRGKLVYDFKPDDAKFFQEMAQKAVQQSVEELAKPEAAGGK